MKKRKKLGTPLQEAVTRNIEREGKHDKREREGVQGGHKGEPKQKGLVNIQTIRTVLSDAWARSKSYHILMKCLNFHYLTKWEEKHFSKDEKRIEQGHRLRYKRWLAVMSWWKDVMPKASESSSRNMHLYNLSITNAVTANSKQELEMQGFNLTDAVRQIALHPKDKEYVAMIERHRKESKDMLNKIKEKEGQKLLDYKSEVKEVEKEAVGDQDIDVDSVEADSETMV